MKFGHFVLRLGRFVVSTASLCSTRNYTTPNFYSSSSSTFFNYIIITFSGMVFLSHEIWIRLHIRGQY
jgi:hypothetical protein